MTKTEKAVSWSLTGFFGFICLAAAPQLSVGLFIKYGILSGALGFGITAISSAVGKAFPDDGYTYNASGSRTVHHHHHHDDSDYTSPRQNNWYWFGLGNSHANRSTSSHGTYLGSRVEPVSTTSANTSHGTYLGSRVEPVQQSVTPPLYPSASSSNVSHGTYLGSRVEPAQQSYKPSAPVSDNANNGTFLGTRYESVVPSYTPSAASHSNSGGGFFSGFGSSDSSSSAGLSSEATHVSTRYEPV